MKSLKEKLVDFGKNSLSTVKRTVVPVIGGIMLMYGLNSCNSPENTYVDKSSHVETDLKITEQMDLDSLSKTLTYNDARKVVDMYISGDLPNDSNYILSGISGGRDLVVSRKNTHAFVGYLNQNFNFDK